MTKAEAEAKIEKLVGSVYIQVDVTDTPDVYLEACLNAAQLRAIADILDEVKE